MADAGIQGAARRTVERRVPSDTSGDGLQVLRLLPVFGVLLFVLGVGWWYWPKIVTQDSLVATGLAILLSAFLSLLPALICIVQNIATRRQLDSLSTLQIFPVSETVSFRVAQIAIGNKENRWN